ncbi:MAG: HI0074 family nucleotidyltransferase substrate-binding subunit [Nitrospirota bacterium]
MERLKLKYKDAIKALNTLKQILEEPFSVIVRDAGIQRFEYTFEAVWKFIKEYLKEQEGIICNSPKSCFRELFSLGLLTEEEIVKFLDMTDDRNMTTHTYREGVAEDIYENIPDYYSLMATLMDKVEIK